MHLDDLISYLLENHERIHAAQAGVESAGYLSDRAWAAWSPSLDLLVEGGHESYDKSKEHHTATWKFRNEQRLTLTQKVMDFGATSGNIAMFEAMSEEAKSRLNQAEQETILRGLRAYFSVIRGRELVKYARRSEANIKRLSGMQEALVERGAGLSYEELQVKGQLAGAQALVVNQERALQAGLNNFKAVYGFSPTMDHVVDFVMPQLPLALVPETLDESVTIAYEENPFLGEMMHAITRREAQVTATQAALYPEVDLVGEYVRKEQDQGAEGIRYEARGSLQFSYNIYNGGGDLAASKSARADLLVVRKTIQDRKRLVEENVRNAWNDLKLLRKNVELFENQANITWEFLALVKKKKAMGAEVGLLDILVGERDYINAISAKVASELDYSLAAYTLLYQLGRMHFNAIQL